MIDSAILSKYQMKAQTYIPLIVSMVKRLCLVYIINLNPISLQQFSNFFYNLDASKVAWN